MTPMNESRNIKQKNYTVKCGGAKKIRTFRYQDTHAVRNVSATIKASRAHHQDGSPEAPKKGDKGDDNTSSGHHELYK